MNPRKGFLISLLTVAALLLCVFAMPQSAHAAGESDLTFTLNATGDGYIVSACDNSATGELVIPGTYMGKPVTGIGDRAFYGCAGLTGVTIPDSVQSFGDWAFFGCLNLSYNEYRYGKYLGNANNPYMILVGIISNALTEFTVHPDTLAIDAFVFSQCPGLTSITIPNSVTSIGDWAFSYCDNLNTVTFCGTQEEWDAIEAGECNESLFYAALQLHNYENKICTICGYKDYISGDMDGNGEVTYQDAVYLLLNILFGDAQYPLNGMDADIDGNGIVEQDDAVYLLLHSLFGEVFYPLRSN